MEREREINQRDGTSKGRMSRGTSGSPERESWTHRAFEEGSLLSRARTHLELTPVTFAPYFNDDICDFIDFCLSAI